VNFTDAYDAFLVDLDGVVWRGDEAIAGASDAIRALRESDKHVVFVTNNASRSPRDYAAKLMRMRIPTEPADIISSAHAVIEQLRAIGLKPGDRVHVCGTAALAQFIAGQRFAATDETHDVRALVVAWNPKMVMDDIRRAADVARSGVPFIGANRDATYPTEDGLLPGSGAIIAAIEVASGRTATIVGKPEPKLFRVALERAGSDPARTLVVGDRADSDVSGAKAAGLPVALVLTGVTAERDLPSLVVRPDYIVSSIAEIATSGGAVESGEPFAASAEDDDEDHAGDEPADVSEEGGPASLFDLS
jgi:HAD superfamily hydrolase (TIGR01450 family)